MNAKRDRRLTPCAGIWTCCLACIVSISGCYKYVPVTNPEPGRPVRAYLTATGGESVVPRFGPGVTELTGTVLSRVGDELSLLVEEYYSPRVGNQSSWNESVRLSPAAIERLQEKRLDGARSALFGAGLAASLALVVVALDLDQLVFSPDDEGDPGPTQLRSRAYFLGFRFPAFRSPARGRSP